MKKTKPEVYLDAATILGRNVRRLRLEKNISYRKFADMAETDTSQIQRIEKGQINTSVSTIFALAQALGVEPAKLLEE